MNWYFKVLNEYVNFQGRARRKEYWMYQLVNFLVAFAIGFVVGLLDAPKLISHFYTALVFLPGLAVGVRRMHDINRSGWWLLAPFYNLYLLCQPGDAKFNDYGHDPKVPVPTNPVPDQKSA